MTFLRSSDVKNHLYTGSGHKHRLVTEDADPASINQTSPARTQGIIAPVNDHPAIAIGAPVPTDLVSGTEAEEQAGTSNSLHVITKVAKAA